MSRPSAPRSAYGGRLKAERSTRRRACSSPEGVVETDGVSLFTLPEGRAALLRLTGPYEALPEAWNRLFDACNGHVLAGLNREVYAETRPEDIRTDLYALLA